MSSSGELGLLALETEKIFLGVRTNLDGCFGGDDSFDGLPFSTVLG